MLKIDFTLTAKIRSKVASSTSRIGRLRCVTPALLTTMSGTPNTLVGALDRRVPRPSPEETSASMAIAPSPIASATRAGLIHPRMSTAATRAPSAAKRRAMPSPNPLPAPVTSAIFPRQSCHVLPQP